MNKKLEQECYDKLDCHAGYIKDLIYDMCVSGGAISLDYANQIIDATIDLVVEDLIETADQDDWNNDDVKYAFSRAICKKLFISI